jgi:YgiT-type zinc finger domain-containing protein
MTLPIDRCPFCSGEITEKTVTEVIRGGGNTATLTINALVCQRCGERFYDTETIEKFEAIKADLESQKTEDLKPVGQAFEVV